MPIDTHCMEKVDLFVSARDLPKIPILSATDAFAVVFLKNNQTNELELIATTPVITDTANPKWSTRITLDYMFEVVQEMAVRVYHFHEGSALTDFQKHTFLGEVNFLLPNLVQIQDQRLSLALAGGKAKGHVDLRLESHTNTRDVFCASFRGIRLSNKDGFFGTSDPFIVVSRLNEDNQYTVVWKSDKIDNTLSPVWPAAKIPMAVLCNGDLHCPLKLEIFDWDSNGKHQTMGHVETSVNAMLALGEGEMDVIEPEKVKTKKTYTNSGHLVAGGVHVEHHPTRMGFHANNTFQPFEQLIFKFNPAGQDMKEIFLKTNNVISGSYLAELTKEVIADPESSKNTLVEWRISIYGRKASEWDDLARWFYVNRLTHGNVRWLIQIPRLYHIYKASGEVETIGQMLQNIFDPLFAVSIDPASNPPLHYFLQTVVGIDSVDDEYRREAERLFEALPDPDHRIRPSNPPYAYYMYYMYANLCALNQLRAARGLCTFQFRPHCGEAEDVDHLLSTYSVTHHIKHSILLRKSAAIEYLYEIARSSVIQSAFEDHFLGTHNSGIKETNVSEIRLMYRK